LPESGLDIERLDRVGGPCGRYCGRGCKPGDPQQTLSDHVGTLTSFAFQDTSQPVRRWVAGSAALRPAKIGEMAKQKQPKEPMPPLRVWAGPVALGWLVPGGGHFLLKRNGRAVLLLVSITLMYLCGLMMRGAMFQPQSGDLLTILINTGGFIGDLASGILYLLTVWLGYNQPDVAGLVHDYGTKFLVTAGLLNVLAMVDAFEIAAGRKS
jgi:hypothetical protein